MNSKLARKDFPIPSNALEIFHPTFLSSSSMLLIHLLFDASALYKIWCLLWPHYIFHEHRRGNRRYFLMRRIWTPQLKTLLKKYHLFPTLSWSSFFSWAPIVSISPTFAGKDGTSELGILSPEELLIPDNVREHEIYLCNLIMSFNRHNFINADINTSGALVSTLNSFCKQQALFRVFS